MLSDTLHDASDEISTDIDAYLAAPDVYDYPPELIAIVQHHVAELRAIATALDCAVDFDEIIKIHKI